MFVYYRWTWLPENFNIFLHALHFVFFSSLQVSERVPAHGEGEEVVASAVSVFVKGEKEAG